MIGFKKTLDSPEEFWNFLLHAALCASGHENLTYRKDERSDAAILFN